MPMPVTIPAAGESSPYMPSAASAESSRKAEPGIDQPFDALARGELVALAMLRDRLRAAAGANRDQTLAQLARPSRSIRAALRSKLSRCRSRRDSSRAIGGAIRRSAASFRSDGGGCGTHEAPVRYPADPCRRRAGRCILARWQRQTRPSTSAVFVVLRDSSMRPRRSLPIRGRWNERSAAHLLRRAGFGGTPDEVRRYAAMSVNAAVESLVRFPAKAATPPPDDTFSPVARTFAVRSARIGATAPDDQRQRNQMRKIKRERQPLDRAMQLWWLDRMLATPAPLQEKMTLYFHGHFTTAGVAKRHLRRRWSTIRTSSSAATRSGNLRELTRNVSKDPAMLVYLDNAHNVAAHPNENYARELMELFTLGVDNYTEERRPRVGARLDRLALQPSHRRSALRAGVSRRRRQDVPRPHRETSTATISSTSSSNSRSARASSQRSLLKFFVYNDPEPELVDAVAQLLRKNDFELAAGDVGAAAQQRLLLGPRLSRAGEESRSSSSSARTRRWACRRSTPACSARCAEWGRFSSIRPTSRAGRAARTGSPATR